MTVGSGAGVVVGFTLPDCVFVELDFFRGDAAKDHSTESAVSYGQGLDPFDRRLFVPQAEIRRRFIDRFAGG